MPRIFAYIAHTGGVPDDTAGELLSAAAQMDAAAPVTALIAGFGPDLDKACESLCKLYPEVWKLSDPALAYPNAELIRKALVAVVPQGSTILVAHSHFGIDLSPGLSIKLDAAYAPDVVGIEGVEGSHLKLIRQEFGGQVSAHVRCDISASAVINIRPGAFPPAANAATPGAIVDKSLGDLTTRRRYVETIVADAGDVDITKHAVLISVGRGIQERDNIAIAEELAEAMGAAVSCSRPVVDANWLPKSRQVGSSGKTVKPKIYMACGISGSFQHLAGLKGNPFIIAINKNPKAPIFRVANLGIVDDILEFLPEMTEVVRSTKPQSAGVGSSR
jgi:electron transfer flavoprotein alpha subunit